MSSQSEHTKNTIHCFSIYEIDLARDKRETLVNILAVYSNRKLKSAMINGDGNENGKKP